MALCWPGTVPHVHPVNNIEVGQPLPRHCQHKYVQGYGTLLAWDRTPHSSCKQYRSRPPHRPTPSPPSPTQVQVLSHTLAHAKRRWLSTNKIIRQDSYTNNTGCIRKTTRL